LSIDATLPTGWLLRKSIIFCFDLISNFLTSCTVVLCAGAVKSYTHVSPSFSMRIKSVRLGIYACLAAMAGAVLYAFVRLYGLNQRVDVDIIIVNVAVFTASGAVLLYLAWKERDIEQEEMFRD
jgi:hypothetical protein